MERRRARGNDLGQPDLVFLFDPPRERFHLLPQLAGLQIERMQTVARPAALVATGGFFPQQLAAPCAERLLLRADPRRLPGQAFGFQKGFGQSRIGVEEVQRDASAVGKDVLEPALGLLRLLCELALVLLLPVVRFTERLQPFLLLGQFELFRILTATRGDATLFCRGETPIPKQRLVRAPLVSGHPAPRTRAVPVRVCSSVSWRRRRWSCDSRSMACRSAANRSNSRSRSAESILHCAWCRAACWSRVFAASSSPSVSFRLAQRPPAAAHRHGFGGRGGPDRSSTGAARFFAKRASFRPAACRPSACRQGPRALPAG